MKLSHLAVTVIEDPDHQQRYRWVLLEATGHDVDQIREFAASEEISRRPTMHFEAGARR